MPGTLSPAALAAFPELTSGPAPAGGTALWGPMQDESELAGLMARFADLGLHVVELRQLPD